MLKSQTSLGTLDEGLDITRPGSPTDVVPSPLTPAARQNCHHVEDIWDVCGRGGLGGTDGDHGFMGAVESPGPGTLDLIKPQLLR